MSEADINRWQNIITPRDLSKPWVLGPGGSFDMQDVRPIPDSMLAELAKLYNSHGTPWNCRSLPLSPSDREYMYLLYYSMQGLVARMRLAEREVAGMTARKDAAYEERNKVVSALARLFPSGIARTAIEGWSEDWHGCVYVDLPTGQVSWHFHDSQAHLFDGLPPYTKPWDGHDTPEKYSRLADLRLDECAGKDAQDAARYRAIRELGAAPADWAGLEQGNVLRFTNLDEHADKTLHARMAAGTHGMGAYERRVKDLAPELGMPLAVARADMEAKDAVAPSQGASDTVLGDVDAARAQPFQQPTWDDPNCREAQMVVIERDASGTPTVWCDPEIADLIRALNAGGVRTEASCSGHGEKPGWIALKDGRQLAIVPDLDSFKRLIGAAGETESLK